MYLSDLIIVLSRPAKSGNVGAVCRAMKNMGLSRLRLAAPEFDVSGGSLRDSILQDGPGENTAEGQELSEAGFGYGGNLAIIRARAVHALDVWENAETFTTLKDAVKDCAVVIGTTRRRGRRRKQVTMTPASAADFLKDRPGPAALVFGNERTGLEDDELDLCNMASHIPVNEVFPSLNLSHAVQIYAYELFQKLALPAGGIPGAFSAPDAGETMRGGPVKGQWVPLDQEAIGNLVGNLTDTLKSLGFYRQKGREEQERFLRDMVSRAALTEREGAYLVSIMTKAARLTVKSERQNFLAAPEALDQK